MKRSTLVWLIIIVILIIDQVSKYWVKTNMALGEDIPILGSTHAYIHFVENPGMAFGIELGGRSGKLILSLFRIGVISVLLVFIHNLIKLKAPKGFLVCFALIAAGAIGNIIDSAFYGMIFSASPYHAGTAVLFPEAGGYAGFLQGKVVDMFYFPLLRGTIPDWFPFWKGEYFEFFRPVFNVADASISTGVISIILFYRAQFSGKPEEKKAIENTDDPSSIEESDTQVA